MNKPKIRFKGFEGEWKRQNLGDISASFSGGTPAVSVSDYYGGNIPFIRSGEIHENRTQLYITQAGLNNSSAKIVEKGTILYALYGATSGDVGGAINQAILAIEPAKKYIDRIFLVGFLQSYKHRIINELLQGGQGNLSGSLVKKFLLAFPSLPEQRVIASYFTALDTQIAASTSRLSSLKQIKAASLLNMFPQKGEMVPRVRFKGFQGEWKEIKLGEIFSVEIGEFVIKTKQKNNAPYPVYNGGVSNTGFYDCYNQEGPKIIVSARGANAGYVNYCTTDFWAGNSCYSIGAKNNDELKFFFYFLKRFQEIYMKNQYSASIPSISKQQILRTNLIYPSLPEQRAIASYFTALDAQITLHRERLEKLKQIKAACLERMFA